MSRVHWLRGSRSVTLKTALYGFILISVFSRLSILKDIVVVF